MVDQKSVIFCTSLVISMFYCNYCDLQTHNDSVRVRTTGKHEKREQMYHYKGKVIDRVGTYYTSYIRLWKRNGQWTLFETDVIIDVVRPHNRKKIGGPKLNTVENVKNFILSLIRPKAPIFAQDAGAEALLIHTPGCYIPNYKKPIVFGRTIYRNTACGQRAVFITKIYDDNEKTRVVFKIESNILRNYVKNEIYACCYNFAFRSIETRGQASSLNYTTCQKFRSGTKIHLKHEVIIVRCFTLANIGSTLYEDAYRFVKKLPKIYEMKSKEDSWNVLLIGMDTLSRARISTAMPKMVKYLQAEDWLDFRGYEKIGANSFPNLVSLLTGQKIETIDKACSLGMHKCNNITVWNTFREAGYITAFGEDYIQRPDIFSKYNGFKRAPTHHYMRTLFLTGEELRGNVLCTKHQTSAKHIYDYAYDFANTYTQEKFFGTFWITSFSHDTDNLPSMFEKDTIEFLEKLKNSGILKNTFIMLISDHGTRFGHNRLEKSSFYEERMPMLFIRIPMAFRKKTWYQEKYYNLQVNQNRLVTPYDIYLTLVKISDMSINSVDIVSEACPACRTLFEEKSLYRTCDAAGINESFCTCRAMTNLDNVTDIDAQNSVKTGVSYIQNYTLSIQTSDYTTCRPLRLGTVFRIHSYMNQMNKKNYVIAFQMVEDHLKGEQVPKNITYEMTVLKQKYKLVHVDIISSYNSTNGDCVKNQRDRGFCICTFI